MGCTGRVDKREIAAMAVGIYGFLACEPTPGRGESPSKDSGIEPPSAALTAVKQDSPGVGHCRGWTHNDPCLPRRPTLGAPKNKIISNRGDANSLDLHCLLRPDRLNEAGVLTQSRVVATMFSVHDLDLGADGLFRPSARFPTLAELPDNDAMCDDEVFIHQPRGAWCGAVLVARRTVLMAEHCVDNFPSTQKEMRIVFDFAMPPAGGPLTLAPASICTIAADPRKTVLHDQLTLMDIDCPDTFAREPVKIAAEMPTEGQVYAIGFPRRLPAKFSGWANVKPIDALRFHAGLDVFPGNSGSPVFGPDHALVGIVEGDESDDTCEDPVRHCKRWESIPSDSHERVIINSTHELLAELSHRPTQGR